MSNEPPEETTADAAAADGDSTADDPAADPAADSAAESAADSDHASDTNPDESQPSEADDEPHSDSDGESHASSAPTDSATAPDSVPDRDGSSVSSSVRSSIDSESEHADAQGNEEEEGVDPEFRKRFNAARTEFTQLRNLSIQIQRKLLDVFPALGFDDSSSTGGVSDFPHRYQDALERVEASRIEYEQRKAHNEALLQSLQAQCAEADQRRVEKEDAFARAREDSGKRSIMSRTNKPIRPTDLNSKEGLLSSKNFELEVARIDFIRTKNLHRQTEDELNKQDQLSEGLHLIDFEQLKIENQSLNEKKAGKNQDLVKIEDKIRVNAHMLTHVKEKLAFVRKQKTLMSQGKQETEDRYGESRAKLAAAKSKRDSLRDANSTLKKSSGLIGMNDLLYDFENRSNELESMQERASDLKMKFNDVVALQRELEAKIAQRRPIDEKLLKFNR
jgi:hypothetical protein